MNTRPETDHDAREFLDSVNADTSIRSFSRNNEMSNRTVRRWMRHCECLIDNGFTIPDGMKLKGTSFLRDAQTGEKKMEWVKTTEDIERKEEMMREAIAALREDIPRELPNASTPLTNEKLASCYVVTDYHMGMLSWAGETGDDWDTEIASKMLIDWFGAAIEAAPASNTAILAQLGDFLHYDSLNSVTPASGHVLDADARYPKIVRAAIRGIRQIVQMLFREDYQLREDAAREAWACSYYLSGRKP